MSKTTQIFPSIMKVLWERKEEREKLTKPQEGHGLGWFFLLPVDLYVVVLGHAVRLSHPASLLCRHSSKRKDDKCLLKAANWPQCFSVICYPGHQCPDHGVPAEQAECACWDPGTAQAIPSKVSPLGLKKKKKTPSASRNMLSPAGHCRGED